MIEKTSEKSKVLNARDIVGMVSDGKIPLSEAERMLREIHEPKARILHLVIEDNFIERQAIEERSRQYVSLYVYAVIGFFDGLIDSAWYAVSEFTEDTTFGISRTLARGRDGWNRGQQRLEKGGKK